MILVDSNVILYAAGGEHPHKASSVELLERAAAARVEAAIDTEVLQELLHRYRAIRRWPEGRRVYDLARRVFPTILPVTVQVLDAARALLDRHDALSARDAVHAAVVEVNALEAICSFDADFDGVPGLRRLEPGRG